MTRNSAIAEGPRDALVSRNSATTNSATTICVILRLAVFTQYRSVTDTHTHIQMDGQVNDDGMNCVSIASRGKNRPYCTAQQVNYQATSVG